MAVVDPDSGVELPAAVFDEHGRLTNADACIGELVGRKALSNFEGYYNNPEADAERTRNGWYWSGDLAYRDAEGIFYFAGRTGDWLRVDSENFAAAPVERILARFEGASGVAVYPVPDPSTGDQVMAALELEAGVAFDPDAFTAFLAAQEDLGTKWAPRFVRVVSALPVTATDKTDKKPLRAQRWETDDPVWHRVGRSDRYVPLTPADVERHGRRVRRQRPERPHRAVRWAAAGRHTRSTPFLYKLDNLCKLQSQALHAPWEGTWIWACRMPWSSWPGAPPGWGGRQRTASPATGPASPYWPGPRRSLDETAEALQALGSPDAIGLRTDLLDQESVEWALAQVGDRWGHCNALVNAAGPFPGGIKSFEEYTDAEWLDVVNGITLSSVRTVRAALPLLRRAEWARIVNVSAMSTKRQSASLVAYTAAKNALTSLTKNLSMSLAGDGILVNTVSPGTYVSESFKNALRQLPDVDEEDLYDVMRYITRDFGHPVHLNRAGDPKEIGPVIAFAASARNTYMTGANINVDGGSDFT